MSRKMTPGTDAHRTRDAQGRFRQPKCVTNPVPLHARGKARRLIDNVEPMYASVPVTGTSTGQTPGQARFDTLENIQQAPPAPRRHKSKLDWTDRTGMLIRR